MKLKDFIVDTMKVLFMNTKNGNHLKFASYLFQREIDLSRRNLGVMTTKILD